MCIVTEVYVLPVRMGFPLDEYIEIWDKIVESVNSL